MYVELVVKTVNPAPNCRALYPVSPGVAGCSSPWKVVPVSEGNKNCRPSRTSGAFVPAKFS